MSLSGNVHIQARFSFFFCSQIPLGGKCGLSKAVMHLASLTLGQICVEWIDGQWRGHDSSSEGRMRVRRENKQAELNIEMTAPRG